MKTKHYTEDDVNRVAEDIWRTRMKKGEYWGTAEGDYKYAQELCERWWGNGVNT